MGLIRKGLGVGLRSRLSIKVALEESLGQVVGSIDGSFEGRLAGRRRGRKDARVHIGDREGGESGSSGVRGEEAAASFLVTNSEGGRRVFTGDGAGSKIGNHAEVLNDGHPQNGIDGHIIAKAERNADWITSVIDVRRLVADDGG